MKPQGEVEGSLRSEKSVSEKNDELEGIFCLPAFQRMKMAEELMFLRTQMCS